MFDNQDTKIKNYILYLFLSNIRKFAIVIYISNADINILLNKFISIFIFHDKLVKKWDGDFIYIKFIFFLTN